MSKESTDLKLVNNYLKGGENRNRVGWAKNDQLVLLHQALHHRSHQQEY